MPRIRVLDDGLINLIAAGEVVERPASVVKELVENAVDAGATEIRVELEAGGLNRVTVIDDGIGMSPEDVQLAVLRHATSKLKDADGLAHIETKGFRGEALAAIAAVSRFSIHTSEAGTLVGTRLMIDGGSPPLLEDAAPAGGTRIEAREIFFNTPARRKFMKRESTELVHAQEAVIRIALAHPEVAFHLSHDGKTLLASPANRSDLTERIAAALGTEVHAHLLPIEDRRLGITVTGYVASPELTLPTARGLYTFVNHRYVRDRGLNSAIQRAFHESLPPGRQPVATIFIELDPTAVDVNVHPQKLEVRFQDGRGVADAVLTAVAKALKSAPWRQQGEGGVPQGLEGAHYALAVERFLARAQAATPGLPLVEPIAGAEARSPAFGEALPSINEAPPPGFFGHLTLIGTLAKRFWVCESPGGSLVVLDPVAVRERLVLDELRSLDPSTADQPTLFSERVTLSAPDCQALLGAAAALAEVGLTVEAFGGETLLARTQWRGLSGVALGPVLQALADAIRSQGGIRQALAAVLAEREAAPQRHDDVHRWLAALDEADFTAPARHARVVVHEVPLLELVSRA